MYDCMILAIFDIIAEKICTPNPASRCDHNGHSLPYSAAGMWGATLFVSGDDREYSKCPVNNGRDFPCCTKVHPQNRRNTRTWRFDT